MSEPLQLDPALTLEKVPETNDLPTQSCARTAAGAQRSWNSLEEIYHPRNKKTPGDAGKQKIDGMTRGVPDRDKLILIAVHGAAKSTIPNNNVLQRMRCVYATNGKDTTKPIVLLN